MPEPNDDKSKKELEKEIIQKSELEEFVSSDEESEKDEESEEFEKNKEIELNLDNLRNIGFERSPTGWTISSSKAPVLEDITEDQEGSRFVRTRAGFAGQTSARTNTQESSDESTYVPVQDDEQTTYTPSTESGEREIQYEKISTSPQRINPATIRFDTFPRILNQETFFTQSREAQFGGGSGIESINVQAQRIDTSSVGRENPLEADFKKYEKYDPDRPSAR